MGGMTYEEAYALVFKTDLRARLNGLVQEYGADPGWFCWELGVYGWDKPADLLAQL